MKKEVNKLEMSDFAKEFLLGLKAEKKQATVVELRGNLGAGKTTFTQCIAKEFGIKDDITSPTFVILKKYEISGNENFDNLIHVDAYRLNGPEELSVLGWGRVLENPRNIVFIEWPGIVSEILPKNTVTISFSVENEESRTIEVEY